MLFITCRLPEEDRESSVDRTFTFDHSEGAPSNHVYYCEHSQHEGSREIMSPQFLQRVRETEHDNVLLFLHGFNVKPEEALEMGYCMQEIVDEMNAKTLVIPLIWPANSQSGLARKYWSDQQSADASGRPFARVLSRFQEWSGEIQQEEAPCLKRINVLAHSMGNRVFRESLRSWRHDSHPAGLPMIFRSVFMAAADVVNETLEDNHLGQGIIEAANNIVCYYAADDLALRASKGANLKNGIASRRLGHSGPEDLDRCPRTVTAFDCDDFNLQCDTLGHSYYHRAKDNRITPLAEHMIQVIKTGRVPTDDTGHPRRSRLQWKSD